MQKKSYHLLVASLYFNYIFQGMAAIILSQNMNELKVFWQATTSQVTLVMSAIGLGRVLVLYFSGYFSDHFGRKKTVIIAIVSYAIFFLGLLLSRNYLGAAFFALFGGVSNAFLDTSTYPTLMEAYPNQRVNSSLSVLNKAFISTGQFILPFLTRFLIQRGLFFGWTFILCAICLLANMILLISLSFPPLSTREVPTNNDERTFYKPTNHGIFRLDGTALLVFSFVSVSIFNIFILWIPQFVEEAGITTHENSLMFVSIYSAGSFISVFLTSAIVKNGVHIPKFILFCLIVSASALFMMLVYPVFSSVFIASILIGLFAAGGIWQLGLMLMLEMFPVYKGKCTSYYSLATAIGIMVIPYITGNLNDLLGINAIFWFNFLLVLIGLCAALMITMRYNKLFKKTEETVIL